MYNSEKYEKKGYLNSDFKMFHLVDNNKMEIDFHYHDFEKVVLFISGNVSYNIEGKIYKLEPYDIVLVGAGEVHKPIIEDDLTYERIIIYISTKFIAEYDEEGDNLNYCFEKARIEKSNVIRLNSFVDSKLYDVFTELKNSYNDNLYASELYKKILFIEFMIFLNRNVIANNITYIDNYSYNSTINNVINYIAENLTEELSIDKISSDLFINKYYLMHTFKEQTGYTVANYIKGKRLILAKKMINSGKPVTETCYECGFSNYSTFSRAYKKQFGKSARIK